MPCIMESASLEPTYGNKFVAGGEDMWVHVFDFHTGAEIGEHTSLTHPMCFHIINAQVFQLLLLYVELFRTF